MKFLTYSNQLDTVQTTQYDSEISQSWSNSPEMKRQDMLIPLFHRAFQFTIYNGPTNVLVRNININSNVTH
jgi:hypothetical protein